jgi:hypothetical protein
MGKRRTSNTSDVLSASEIGQYIYCSHGWQLRRMGYEPESPLLEQGARTHAALGNKFDDFEVRLRSSRWCAVAGLILLSLSLLLLFGVIL